MSFSKMRTSMALALILLSLSTLYGFAQSVTSGDLSGTVTDSSGAVIPQATVTLKSTSEGSVQTTSTNQSGNYHFSLLKPGNYVVSASAANMAETQRAVDVQIGQITTVVLSLGARGQNQTIEVTAEVPLLQTENPNLTTTISEKQIALQPNPGNDTTFYAQTTPGVAMNVGSAFGGYGNFSAFGLPATSNLFTLDGNDNNDPYLQLNNSGSSNLTLGANEIQEVAVVTNGYTAQYGRQAGVQMDSTTKSGSNQFHGNANYYYNGDVLNANDYFNKFVSPGSPVTPRPFAVNNQWSTSFGGPIIKNKTFFFVDYEGLRYVLPSTQNIFLPSPQFESAVIGNLNSNVLNANQSAEVPFYNKLFGLYNGTPTYAQFTPAGINADPSGNQGCGDLSGKTLNGTLFGQGAAPCALFYHASGTNLNKEWLFAGRVDHTISNNDKIFGRIHIDRGHQPTTTDIVNQQLFGVSSNQPTDDGQLNWTHVFSPNVVNSLVASGMWYSTIFEPNSPASVRLAAMPYDTIAFTGNALFSDLGGTQGNSSVTANFPQGRNVTQYQVIDDLSINRGNHTVKFGMNFRRNDISDFGNQNFAGGQVTFQSVTDFANGVLNGANGGQYLQQFTNFPENPIAIYSLGLYAQDEWSIRRNLKLTVGLRADRNSNAVCQTNCFSRLAVPFDQLDHDVNIPYNQIIQTNQHRAFSDLQSVALQPRIGISWSPFGRNTVIRAGAGLFSDLYQGVLVSDIELNSPTLNAFTLSGHALNNTPVAPGVTFGTTPDVQTSAVNSNAAFNAGFASGATLASLSTVPGFAPPTYFSTDKIKNPTYVKWNVEIQQALGSKTSFDMNYVGTHGYDELIFNGSANAYNAGANLPLPSSAPDARFGQIFLLSPHGVSNYAGLITSLTRRAGYGFSGQLNYTWSHALDDVTGLPNTPYNFLQPTFQLNPNNLRQNYGNSDSDIRHNLTATYVWELPYKFQNRLLEETAGGWSISGIFFARSGLPYSVYDTNVAAGNIPAAFGIFATLLPGQSLPSCGTPGTNPGDPHACLSSSMFVPSGTETGLGSPNRNYFRGPSYFDTDTSLMKNFNIGERVRFSMGANFYNILNHPHFALPQNNLAAGTFGQFFATAPQPTSIYGAFQTAGVTGRLVQIVGKLTF
jgi:carboxypeptidase family protein/TonB-dependent receptor-like protein